jgi:hypothetical protein
MPIHYIAASAARALPRRPLVFHHSIVVFHCAAASAAPPASAPPASAAAAATGSVSFGPKISCGTSSSSTFQIPGSCTSPRFSSTGRA